MRETEWIKVDYAKIVPGKKVGMLAQIKKIPAHIEICF